MFFSDKWLHRWEGVDKSLMDQLIVAKDIFDSEFALIRVDICISRKRSEIRKISNFSIISYKGNKRKNSCYYS